MSIDRVGELGIVGAGGGGFPTAVKLGTRVPLVIANAAECEPLPAQGQGACCTTSPGRFCAA